MSVMKAEFQAKGTSGASPKSLETLLGEMVLTLTKASQQAFCSTSSSSLQSPTSMLLNCIRGESLAEQHPVVLVWNAYDLGAEDLAEIEVIYAM